MMVTEDEIYLEVDDEGKSAILTNGAVSDSSVVLCWTVCVNEIVPPSDFGGASRCTSPSYCSMISGSRVLLKRFV